MNRQTIIKPYHKLRVEGFFLIQDSGVPIYSTIRKRSPLHANPDLLSGFIRALLAVAEEVLDARVDEIPMHHYLFLINRRKKLLFIYIIDPRQIDKELAKRRLRALMNQFFKMFDSTSPDTIHFLTNNSRPLDWLVHSQFE